MERRLPKDSDYLDSVRIFRSTPHLQLPPDVLVHFPLRKYVLTVRQKQMTN